MELLQIIYFCDAAQTENFSKTAQRFYVPPSNISQSVHRLEKELGTNLFDRTSNKISLNEQGKAFYIRAKKALDLLNEAKTVIKDSDGKIIGDIKICICTNRRIVTQTIEEFRKKFPQVSFVINHDISFADYDFDLIIADGGFKRSGYEKTLLVKENLVLAVSEDNPLAGKSRITAEDLKQQRFITMPAGSSLYRHTNSICRAMGFDPDIAIQSDDPFYIRKYVELGLGIAVIPSISWQGQFSENIIFKKIESGKRSTYVFRKKDKYMSNTIKTFLDALISEFKKYK